MSRNARERVLINNQGQVMNLDQRNAIEKDIYKRIVQDALILGYTISVFDGEEYALNQSENYFNIIEAGFSTDAETLIFYQDKQCIGSVDLVYGNTGWDVISDYSDNEDTEFILRGAEMLAETLEDLMRLH